MRTAVNRAKTPTIDNDAQSLEVVEGRLSAHGEHLRSRTISDLWLSHSMRPARDGAATTARRSGSVRGSIFHKRAAL